MNIGITKVEKKGKQNTGLIDQKQLKNILVECKIYEKKLSNL